MDYGLLIIFYYGILHALGPDHLSAIAIFSIGKAKKETFILTILFAIGHGVMLYLLALLIQYVANEELLSYGDTIASFAILIIGLYLFYLTFTKQITINKHHHNHEKHTHIYYKNAHFHDKSMILSLGLLMGVGGIRGMLITLGVVSHNSVGVEMVLVFILGVSSVFLLFGYAIFLFNQHLIDSEKSLRYGLMSIALLSIFLGTYNLIGETYVT